ncbi:MAG: DegT/DnrJ/EryC1/StrS family aminotransferase [Candidatus Eremiobacteraeota bacterium]|nr:DegT/DnrJ/EryC1/StrS family aminotransferase [Candidatus Eremiobacteraeota bacterium]
MLSSGKWVDEFDEKFARYIGVKDGCSTSSGTTALHLALAATGISPGDKVLTTAMTFIATANSILYCGGIPVFADIDPVTFNISPYSVKQVLEQDPEIKYLLVVHLFGLSCDMAPLMKICKEHGVTLIEDCAQAHGALYHGRKVGTFGKAAIFSFYPTKNMTTGEGGMIISDDPEIIRHVKILRDHGMDDDGQFVTLGYNFRLTNIEAAIGICQLERLDEFNRARRKNAAYYNEYLGDLPFLELPVEPEGYKHVYHQYTVRLKVPRPPFLEYLRANNIGYKIYYPLPVHKQVLYRNLGYGDCHYPEAENAAEEVVSIPVHPAISERDRERIVECIRQYRPGGLV